MSRAKSINFKGEGEGHSATSALLDSPGDLALDRRGVARAYLMKCPDGCGSTLTINLDGRSGKAWRNFWTGGKITVYPSVWRDEGCKAHFIIWRDNILWCDGTGGIPWHDPELIKRVLDFLRCHQGFNHYEVIAEQIDCIPWEAAWACDALVRQGKAIRNKRSFYQAIASGERD